MPTEFSFDSIIKLKAALLEIWKQMPISTCKNVEKFYSKNLLEVDQCSGETKKASQFYAQIIYKYNLNLNTAVLSFFSTKLYYPEIIIYLFFKNIYR